MQMNTHFPVGGGQSPYKIVPIYGGKMCQQQVREQ